MYFLEAVSKEEKNSSSIDDIKSGAHNEREQLSKHTNNTSQLFPNRGDINNDLSDDESLLPNRDLVVFGDNEMYSPILHTFSKVHVSLLGKNKQNTPPANTVAHRRKRDTVTDESSGSVHDRWSKFGNMESEVSDLDEVNGDVSYASGIRYNDKISKRNHRNGVDKSSNDIRDDDRYTKGNLAGETSDVDDKAGGYLVDESNSGNTTDMSTHYISESATSSYLSPYPSDLPSYDTHGEYLNGSPNEN